MWKFSQLANRRTFWRRTERLLLVSGLALLAVYGAFRIDSFFGSRAALKKFAAIDSPSANKHGEGESTVGESSPQETDSPQPDLGPIDFSLWDQHRVTLASAEEPAATLPETGSSLPLVGLLGALALAASLGLGAARQALKA